jgi:hypothetical protein
MAGKQKPLKRCEINGALEKLCVRCERWLPLTVFGKRSDYPHLMRSECKECYAMRYRQKVVLNG